jgi:hypothetical protein
MAARDTSFARLSDDELLAEVKRLAACERRATAALIRSLIELDARRLYLGEGCSSLFTYCTQVLHLSESAAYNRIEAARASRRFPPIVEALEEGHLTLTAVRLLAPHLSAENNQEILASARHKSKREVEQLVASLNPKPAVSSTIRKLPVQSQARATAPVAPAAPAQSPATAPAIAGRATTPAVTPMAPEHYKVQLTISHDTHAKLRRAQALLRHAIPSGDAAEIFDRALTLLLQDAERRRCGATSTPRQPLPARDGSRHIPAAVKREVWRRDEGRCAFVGRNGRCTEQGFLEYHHMRPYAAGGTATPANIELRCRAHNVYEAALFFGTGTVDFVREVAPLYATDVLQQGLRGTDMGCRATAKNHREYCDKPDPSKWDNTWKRRRT